MKSTSIFSMFLRESDYDVEIEFIYHVDRHYGADADGNRGITAYEIEDLTFKVIGEDGGPLTLSAEEHKLVEARAEEEAYDAARSDEGVY